MYVDIVISNAFNLNKHFFFFFFLSEFMNHDLNGVSLWCNLWGMKLNASKTKTMGLQVTHSSSSVNPIDSRWNCAEGV